MQTKKCDLNKIWNSIEIELLTDDNEVSFESWAGAASAVAPITLSSLSFSERSGLGCIQAKEVCFSINSTFFCESTTALFCSAARCNCWRATINIITLLNPLLLLLAWEVRRQTIVFFNLIFRANCHHNPSQTEFNEHSASTMMAIDIGRLKEMFEAK